PSTPTSVAPVTVRPPVKPPEPERPAVSLVGTVIGSDIHIGVFLETATKNVVRLRVGEDHQGWVLRLITVREVTLVKDSGQAVLKLPAPGEDSDGLPRVATGTIPIVSNENYVDEQPRPVRARQRRGLAASLPATLSRSSSNGNRPLGKNPRMWRVLWKSYFG